MLECWHGNPHTGNKRKGLCPRSEISNLFSHGLWRKRIKHTNTHLESLAGREGHEQDGDRRVKREQERGKKTKRACKAPKKQNHEINNKPNDNEM